MSSVNAFVGHRTDFAPVLNMLVLVTRFGGRC